MLRAVTGLLVFRLGASLRGDGMAGARGLVAAVLFLGNPPYARVAGGGKEGALYTLLLVVALLLAGARTTRLPGAAAAFGVLLSALLLARLTPASVLVVGLLLLWARPHLDRRAWTRLAAAFLLPLAAWGAYAWWAFGRVLPTSGAIKVAPTLALLRDEPASTVARRVLELVLAYALEAVRFGVGLSSRFEVMKESLLTWAVALATAAAVLAAGRRHGPHRMLLAASAAGTLLVPVLLVGQGENVFYYSWYLNELPLALALCAAAAVPDLAEARARRLALGAAGVLLVGRAALAGGRVPELVHGARFPAVVLSGVRTATEELHVTADTRIAAFDAGLLGWLLPSHVVNLDGLANDDRYAALQRGVSDQRYVHEQRVEYVINGLKPWLVRRGDIVRSFPLEARAPQGPYVVVRLRADAPCHEGVQDVARCDEVAGWAWDCARPDVAVEVEVLDGATVVATVRADGVRHDLAPALGSAAHGFAVGIPRARGRRTLSTRVRSSGTPLGGSPVPLDCQ